MTSPPVTRAPYLLIIEDNSEQRILLREFLADILITDLEEASDSEAGLTLAQTRPPDLVLLDLHVPPHGGMTVLRTLRADPVLARVPVLVLSGSRKADDLAAIRADPGSRFLEKPYDLDDLEQTIRTMLATRPPAEPAA